MARGWVAGIAGAAAAAAALVYWAQRVQEPARGNPAEFLRQGGAAGRKVVVCLGASIVHGRVSVDFVELLRQRCAGDGYAFVNAGVNGDLSYSALARLDSVIACAPDAVVVLVGTNDVQCTLSEWIMRSETRSGRSPVPPSLDAYRAHMREIVTRLKRETHAAVALASLPVLGEDLGDAANARVRGFNAALRQVAEEEGAAYLPVHERQETYLAAHGGEHGRPYTGSPVHVMTASMEHYLLGRSLDDISRRHGLLLTTDRIHMNSAGAGIIAALVEGFLQQNA